MFKMNKSFVLLFFLFFAILAAGSASATDNVSANFTSNVTNGSAPLSVQFNDTSTGNATSWSWDFGDKQTSTEQNPTHTYTTEGKYNVSFTAINGAGNNTLIKNDYINVAIPPTVTASLTGGTYNTTQTVTLASDDPAATIYYANDKTDPRTSATKIIYTGPITITNTTTLRYAALDTYGNWSILYLQNYVIGNGTVKTGQSNYTGPDTNTTLWNYTTGGNIIYGAPVIGVDGTIYIGSSDGKVYALNPDGSIKWTYSTGAPTIRSDIYSPFAIGDDGTIYVGSYDKNLYAINPDGTSKWNYTTGNYIYGSPAIGADGTIYVGSYDKKLYAINPDGTSKWNYTTGGYIYSYGGSPAIGPDGTIYVGSYDKKLYAINPDGTLKWSYTTGNKIYGSATIGADGTVYVGSYDKNLHAINPDGTLKWSYTTGNYIYGGTPAIGADGTIYVGSYDGNLYAITPMGTKKWAYTTGRIYGASPIIDADGTIYVGSDDNKLFAINPNGTLKWSYTTGQAIRGSATIGSDGTVYFGSYDKNMYALKDVLPVANFTSDVTNGGIPVTVHFTDYSTHDPSIWLWDFGDGTNSTEQNPTHTYTAVGSYTVSLTVFNLVGNSTKTLPITLSILPPVANFTSNVTNGTSPFTVNFTDTSLYATSWAWDFDGDGTTDSTEQNPIYTYNRIPNYCTVRLTVTGPGGSNTTTKTSYILILPRVDLVTGPGGSYSTPRIVTLTTDDSTAIIYYGMDSTDPRNSSTRIQYTGPITVSNTTTLRYAALSKAGNWSPLYMQNYIIGNGTENGGIDDTDWAKSSGDLSNTGQSNCTGPQVNSTLWSYNTGSGVTNYGSPVIGSDGTIYIGANNGKFYALNVDGSIKWTYTTGDAIYCAAIIGSDGTIYVGSFDYKFYAFSPDGILKWNYTTGACIYSGLTIGDDGTIYVHSDDGTFYAFNPNGTVKWTYTTKDRTTSYGCGWAIGKDGTIYMGNRDGKFYALNPDGTPKWTYKIRYNVYGTSIGKDGTIYASCEDGKFYAFNVDGTLKWTYTLGGTIFASAAVGADGTIYIGSTGGNFYALNPDGTLKWSYNTGSVYGAATIDADGTIYVGSTNGQLYAFNPDGTIKWNYTTGSTIQGSVAISKNGTLYFGSGDGKIYALASTVLRANQTVGIPPLTVQFTASAIDPVSWYWDFGDGNTSTEQNPTHTYFNLGYYTVTLIVTNSSGQNTTVSFKDYIKLYESPTSNFTASTAWGTLPDVVAVTYNPIQFNDTSKGTKISWLWDLGDGTTSTEQNPTHTYNTAGNYTVSLKVTNPVGSNTYLKTIQVLNNTLSVNNSLADGIYNTTQKLNLTSNDPTTTIYFTTDSTYPATSSTRIKYTGPISISNTTTIRYAAVTPSGMWSPMDIRNYVIGTGELADSPSPTYQVNNNHTGQSEYTGPQTNTTKWIITDITGFTQDNGVSIGSDGTIYCASYDGMLYAIYSNGIMKWVHLGGGDTPVIGNDGIIYSGGYAIRPDGTTILKYGYGSPIIGADGTIYAGSIAAIDPNGTVKWINSLGSCFTAIGSDGTLYVAGDNLYAVLADGTVKWSCKIVNHLISSPSIGADGIIYIGTSDKKLYAINPDGTVKWTSTTKGRIYGTAAIASDGTIYIIDQGGILYAISSDGKQKWNLTTGGSCYSSPVIGADGTIYIGTQSGIFAVNSNGTIKWSYTGISSNANPVIDSDGTLYVGTNKGLMAFNDVVANYVYTAGSNPLYVQFTDTSTNAITWNWDFGDGSTSTLQNPAHTYGKSGQYLVNLTAALTNGRTLTATKIIRVSDITPPTVIISPVGGTFNTTQTVTLNATDNTDTITVYYTTDGSDPQTSSTRSIYTAPITLTATTTLNYVAVDASGNWSPVYDETYEKLESVSGVIIYVQSASYYTAGPLNTQIQTILDTAPSGSTVEFLGQLYENLQLVINKKLNIISNVGTTLFTSNSSAVFQINGINATGTKISGFTIVNNDTGPGIQINNTGNVTISNVKVSSIHGTAIMVNDSSNTTIRSSSISDSIVGINVSSSSNTQINKNNIYNNIKGIIIENSANTTINKNQIIGNQINGISIGNSNNVTVSGNTIKENGNVYNSGSGVYLENLTNVHVSNNKINENCYGLVANILTNALIENNEVLDNDRDGITLNGMATNTTVLSNTLQKNDVGVRVNCESENLNIRGNLITGNILKSSDSNNCGSGILLGTNYKYSPTFLVNHNVLRDNSNMDFRSCASAGDYLPGSNWYGSSCKQVTHDPQMRMVLTRSGENAFTVQFYDGVTGKLVTDLPSILISFKMGAYSQAAVTAAGAATTVFDNMALMGEVIASSYGVVVSVAYNSEIIPLVDGSDTDCSDSDGTGNGNNPGDGCGIGTGSGSGSGGSSGSGASSGSSSTVGATAAQSSAGSSGSSGQDEGQNSKTAQELIVDDVIRNPNVWAIIGVVLLLILVLGAYYRKDLMNMIKKSKK